MPCVVQAGEPPVQLPEGALLDVLNAAARMTDTTLAVDVRTCPFTLALATVHHMWLAQWHTPSQMLGTAAPTCRMVGSA